MFCLWFENFSRSTTLHSGLAWPWVHLPGLDICNLKLSTQTAAAGRHSEEGSALRRASLGRRLSEAFSLGICVAASLHFHHSASSARVLCSPLKLRSSRNRDPSRRRLGRRRSACLRAPHRLLHAGAFFFRRKQTTGADLRQGNPRSSRAVPRCRDSRVRGRTQTSDAA